MVSQSPEDVQPNNIGKPALAEDDLNVVAQWVKGDLFDKVKFLQNPDTDLTVNGKLYNLLVTECKGRLGAREDWRV